VCSHPLNSLQEHLGLIAFYDLHALGPHANEPSVCEPTERELGAVDLLLDEHGVSENAVEVLVAQAQHLGVRVP
jgi:hypothetical protein